MKKKVFYTEIAYFLGIFLLALGTAMTVFGDFGISMVVAPAYILHLKLSTYWSWFSLGVAEYVLQGILLLVILVFLKGKLRSCLLTFVSALIYGLILDGSIWAVSFLDHGLWVRLCVYILGVLFCTAGLSFLFRCYLAPAAYEFLVMMAADRIGGSVTRWKTAYDCASLVVAVILSWVLLGSIEGVWFGTVICALIYGTLIGMFSKLWERFFTFRDRFPLRSTLV